MASIPSGALLPPIAVRMPDSSPDDTGEASQPDLALREGSREPYRAFLQIKLYMQQETIVCSAEVENDIFL